MGIKKGGSTIRRFYSTDKLPASSDREWTLKLINAKFEDRILKGNENNSGISVFGNELSTNFTSDNAVFGKFILFSVRVDTLKIRNKILDLQVNQIVGMRTADGSLMSSKVRNSIREEVLEQDNGVTMLDIDVANVFIDCAKGDVYTNTTSVAIMDEIEYILQNKMGIHVHMAEPFAVVTRNFDTDFVDKALDTPHFNVIDCEIHPDYEDSEEGKLGSSFLTWLLYYLNVGDGMFNHMGITFLDTLSLEGEAMGSKQASLKKGAISNCVELIAALKVGKTVSSCKLLIAESDGNKKKEYEFTIDKSTLTLSGCKVPKGTLLERLLSFVNCYETIDELFEYYLNTRYSRDWTNEKIKIKDWIENL